MEKFGLFNLLSSLSQSNSSDKVADEPKENVKQPSPQDLKKAKLKYMEDFFLRHEQAKNRINNKNKS